MLSLEQGCTPNTAACQLRDSGSYTRANDGKNDPHPHTLTPALAARLVLFLSQRTGAITDSTSTWKDLRNRAAIAMQLGAGLAPTDIRSLAIDAIHYLTPPATQRIYKVTAPANGNSPARDAPVAGWAAGVLQTWLQMRTRLQIPGDRVFPSTLNGDNWSASQCYRACLSVMVDADIQPGTEGLLALRHTFAVRQLERGKRPADVAKWMGFQNSKSMQRYARVINRPIEVA